MLSVYNRWFIRYNLVFVLGRNILPASRREVRCLRIWNKKFKMYIILWGIKQIWCLQQLTIINKQYFCLIIDFSRVKSLPFGQFLELALPKSQFGCCFGLSVLFFFKLCIYLWLCQVFVAAQAVSSCSEWGCSSFQSEGFSFWQLLLLQSTGSRARAPQLQHVGLVVVAHELSCPEAYGIFPDQGSNPRSLHWQADSQPLDQQKSPDLSVLKLCLLIFSLHWVLGTTRAFLQL